MKTEAAPDGFLSRWSRRKEQARSGVAEAPEALPVAPEPADAPVAARAEPAPPQELPAAAPLPTLADVAQLTRESDYSRFVAGGVDEGVKRAAMKKLFTDPHFNVMDGLDTYIDDYGIPDPLPPGMLQQMAQSRMLGLFTDTPDTPGAPDKPDTLQAPAPAAIAPTSAPTGAPDDPHPTPPAQAIAHEDAALRLQPHHATGPASAGEGAGPDTGRQC